MAKEIGEDAVPDLVQTALELASKTSGAVIELVLSTAPTAANRLGDEALFRAYLQFLNTLLSQAPRGVRPMLENLEMLFSQLTLGGLRRWALWGAHAHRTNYPEQANYFSLQSKESLAMLQKERKGTLFIDVQRRINMYLRALWARDFFMKPTSGDFETREGYRPYVEGYFLHLPDAYDDYSAGETKLAGLEMYRAAAAHSARAHCLHPRPDFGRVAQPLADGGDQRDRGCAGGNPGDAQVSRPQAPVGAAAHDKIRVRAKPQAIT